MIHILYSLQMKPVMSIAPTVTMKQHIPI